MFRNLFRAKANDGKEHCFVYGDDRQFMEKALVSTGAYFVDEDNLLAFLNPKGSMGMYIEERYSKKKGWHEVIVGQCALLFEQSAQAFDFNKLRWDSHVNSDATILTDARKEALGDIIKEQRDDDQWKRWMWALYGMIMVLALVVIIIALNLFF